MLARRLSRTVLPAPRPTKQAKRRDQKATPVSHATTKAKEMAIRKDGEAMASSTLITDLTAGSGGTGQERSPLGRDDLASASKVLFGDVAEEKKTQGSPKSYLQYESEEEALEAAVAEVKAAKELDDEAETDDKAEMAEEEENPRPAQTKE